MGYPVSSGRGRQTGGHRPVCANEKQLLSQDITRYFGRAIAQAVRLWLSTAAARVRVWAEHEGFVVDKVALGQVLSEYFGFPCQSSFHQFLHHNHPGLAQ
jgi:hypothetical protein